MIDAKELKISKKEAATSDTEKNMLCLPFYAD